MATIDCRKHNSGATSPHPMCTCAGPCLLENLKEPMRDQEQLKRSLKESNKSKVNDPVNHPSHYTDGKIEVIDFINDKKLNFNRGNAVKYISRAGKKDPNKEVEDLKKAVFYLNDEIKRLEEPDEH